MFLDKIVATKRQEMEQLRKGFSITNMENMIADLPPCRGFKQALIERKRPMGLIAEVKKASPSKGVIRESFDVEEIARAYEQVGVDCISVLTDEPYFQGSKVHLRRVKELTTRPILRKDFTIDEMQIYEARVIGADAILLIAAILTDDQLVRYRTLAQELGMDVLVEVHDEEELRRSVHSGADLIGINNRDLRTFKTDLQVSKKLLSLLPSDVVTVSESGIASRSEIDELLSYGADAVLVGETFMRQDDIGQAVNDLVGPIGASSP